MAVNVQWQARGGNLELYNGIRPWVRLVGSSLVVFLTFNDDVVLSNVGQILTKCRAYVGAIHAARAALVCSTIIQSGYPMIGAPPSWKGTVPIGEEMEAPGLEDWRRSSAGKLTVFPKGLCVGHPFLRL